MNIIITAEEHPSMMKVARFFARRAKNLMVELPHYAGYTSDPNPSWYRINHLMVDDEPLSETVWDAGIKFQFSPNSLKIGSAEGTESALIKLEPEEIRISSSTFDEHQAIELWDEFCSSFVEVLRL